MNERRLLVTGGAGFTGRYLIKLAQQNGYECTALVQRTPQRPLQCETVECDLLSYDAVENVVRNGQFTHIAHLAAIAYVAHGSVDDIYRTNVVGTTNLLDTLRKHTSSPLQQILVASSGNVYGNNTHLPLSEDSNLMPANDYAVSKCAMEMAIKLRQSELPIIITRPFNYTGLGQANYFLVPKIVDAFKQRQATLRLGNLDVCRDFTDVRDLVSAYIALLSTPSHSATYNVCSGRSISLQHIVEHLSELADFNINIEVDPRLVRQNEIKVLYGSDQKLTARIGDYRQYRLEDTLNWMYRSNE